MKNLTPARWLAVVLTLLIVAGQRETVYAQQQPAPVAPFCNVATPATAEAGALLQLFTSPDGGPKTDLLAAFPSAQFTPKDPNTPTVIALYRLLFSPSAQSASFPANGPMLLLPESGEVVVAVDGSPVALAAGSCLAIKSGQTYAFANRSGAEAVIQRLAITSTDADNPLGVSSQVTITPAPGETPSPYQTGITANLRFRAKIAVPEGGTLFFASATWQSAASAPGSFTHPGLLGAIAINGQAAITSAVSGQNETVSGDQCGLILPDVPYQIAPSADGSSILLFGMLRAGQPLWTAADSSRIVVPPGETPPVECAGAVTNA